jgi:hypothetical protein
MTLMEAQIIELLTKLKTNTILFKDVIAFIEENIDHTPSAFRNGATYNEATQNQGSAKVFRFAQLNNLSQSDTLTLFAEHYQAVLADPDGADHHNIRQFIKNGWAGIEWSN